MVSMKNMREVLSNLSVEDFTRFQIQTLFGLGREEYLEQIPTYKGNGYCLRSQQSLVKMTS